jgi:primary-amine oxidase
MLHSVGLFLFCRLSHNPPPANKFLWPDNDDQLWPAGRHVPQTSGDPSHGLPEWIGDGARSVDNKDVVLWHTFGVVHFPSPEDFPVMPVEPMTLLLRPRNFFASNPVMNVPPLYSSTPSQILANGNGVLDATDRQSRRAFGGANGQHANGYGSGSACCEGEASNGHDHAAEAANGAESSERVLHGTN